MLLTCKGCRIQDVMRPKTGGDLTDESATPECLSGPNNVQTTLHVCFQMLLEAPSLLAFPKKKNRVDGVNPLTPESLSTPVLFPSSFCRVLSQKPSGQKECGRRDPLAERGHAQESRAPPRQLENTQELAGTSSKTGNGYLLPPLSQGRSEGTNPRTGVQVPHSALST